MEEIVFEFDGSAADRDREARHLVGWLNDSRGLRGAARVRMLPPGDGEQGAAADAAIVLASVAPLAQPFFGWLSERVKSRRMRVTITAPGDRSLEIDAASRADAEAALEKIREVLDERR